MSANFVPVAVNLYKIRQAKDAGGELFRSIQSQKPQYQGLWIVSPDGKVFTGHQNVKSQATWTQEVVDTLAAGLKAFGPVTPRQATPVPPLPYRGIGVQPDGSVCLALYTRYVRGGGNRLAPAPVNDGSRWMWKGDLKPDGPPVIDTLALTAGEWATFMPPKTAVGTEWVIPEAVARKFTRALSPDSDQSTMPRPEEATVAELRATVESVAAGQARIRLAGRWEMKHLYESKPSYGWATAEGAALYDLNQENLRSVLLAFSGAYRMVPPYDKEDRPTGAVAEWHAQPSLTSAKALPQDKKRELAPAAIRVAYVSPAVPQPSRQGSADIFHDEFDGPPDQGARYFEVGQEKGSFVWSEGEGYGGRGGAMKCQFDKGQVSAGSLKVLFGKNPFGRGIRSQETFREIYWRVYVKHETGWEGNPAKLGRATCLAGSDWSQGLIAHVWGGKGDALCIDPATGIRDSRKVSDRYNDFAHLRWLGLRQGQTPLFSPAESGRWVCVESHVRLNSPGRSDGVFELWVDGRPEASRSDLDWHGAWNDYAINAVFLENYWNQGAVKRQARWFDNFVISTQPIGPIAATNLPTFTRTPGTKVAAWEAQASADPDGREVVWTSGPQDGAKTSLTIDAAHGVYTGSFAKRRHLSPGATYCLRLRERSAAGAWSAWTAWHAAFRTSP